MLDLDYLRPELRPLTSDSTEIICGLGSWPPERSPLVMTVRYKRRHPGNPSAHNRRGPVPNVCDDLGKCFAITSCDDTKKPDPEAPHCSRFGQQARGTPYSVPIWIGDERSAFADTER